jgi:hypothetical protein
VIKKIILSLALFSASIASSSIPTDGWYGSVFGGYAYLPNHLSAVYQFEMDQYK